MRLLHPTVREGPVSNLVVSLVRTLVAVWVPAVAVSLASLGLDLPIQPATAAITALAISAYYTLARLAETRWPNIGLLLLASNAQPAYHPSTPPQDRVSP
jgi:hypothetical protein